MRFRSSVLLFQLRLASIGLAWDAEEQAERGHPLPVQLRRPGAHQLHDTLLRKQGHRRGHAGRVLHGHHHGHGHRHGRHPGVLNFIFLANNSVPHLSLWSKFFRQAQGTHWRAWLHCVNSTACEQSLGDKHPFQLVPTVPSTYCVDLVRPMVHVLRKALATYKAKSSVVEKYIFVSDTTLPLKPFRDVYVALTADHDSHFCFVGPKSWNHLDINQARVFLPKHSQWMVMSRQHAEIFAKHWRGVHQDGSFRVDLRPDGRSISPRGLKALRRKTRRAIPRAESTTFLGGAGGCADEVAAYSTIFGVFEPWSLRPDSLEGLGVELRNSTPLAFTDGMNETTRGHWSAAPLYMPRSRCTTFQMWPGAIENRANCEDSNLREIFGAFARDKTLELGGTHDGGAHPFTLNNLGRKSLEALRASSFLFGRKFAPGADLEDFDILIE